MHFIVDKRALLPYDEGKRKFFAERTVFMAKVTFDTSLCKGCGLCVGACPKKIVSLSTTTINAKGYYPAQVLDNIPWH